MAEARVKVLSIGMQVAEVESDGVSEFIPVSDLVRVIGSDAASTLQEQPEGKMKVVANMCAAIRDAAAACNKSNSKFVESVCAAANVGGELNVAIMEYRRNAMGGSSNMMRLAGMLQRELQTRKRAQNSAARDVQREVQTGATGTGGVRVPADSEGA